LGNLAYKVRQNHQTNQQEAPQPKVITKNRKGITLGEKLLAMIFVSVIMVGSVQIISNQVAIYNANIEIQQIESSIQDQSKLNSDLHVQVQELSTYERIWAKAQEMGLLLNENNVKVVQGR
jgi:cell division protein FtsL